MPKLTKDQCQSDIEGRILSMDLAPGLVLDEASLVEAYGMSRTPMREVLQRLAGKGYISLEDNRGAKVASMDVGAMRTFFQTAPMIYANTAALAAENRTAEQLRDLKDTQARLVQAIAARDTAQSTICNYQFHRLIGKMARNIYLFAALERLLIDHTRLSQTFYHPHSSDETLLVEKASHQHDAMINAIEDQEPAMATDLTLQHWDLSHDQIERFVRPDPLPIDVLSLKDRSNAI